MIGDIYENDDIMHDELTPYKIEVVRHVWEQVMALGTLKVGQVAFENLFSQRPDFVDYFSFGGDKYYQDSEKFKTQVNKVIPMLHMAITEFNFTPEFTQKMKSLGLQHACYGVRDEHFDVFGQALILSAQAALGESFTFKDHRCLSIFYEELKKMITGGVEEEREASNKMYRDTNITPEEIAEIVKLWKKQIFGHMSDFGSFYFRKLFEMYPEITAKIFGPDWDEHDISDNRLNKLGFQIIAKTKSYVVSLDEPDLLYIQCKADREEVTAFGFTAYDYYVMKEALMLTLESIMKQELSGEQNWAITKTFKIVVNLIHGEDMDKRLDT